MRAREPGLHQRARRRQQEIRQADRRREQAEDQPRRVLGAAGLPVRRRDDRQHGERDAAAATVCSRTPARGVSRRTMRSRIGVAGEQRRLEEDEAGRPDGRRAAEPRQDLLRHHRLDEEQQERADEDRGGVEEHRGSCPAATCGSLNARTFAREDAHSTGCR